MVIYRAEIGSQVKSHAFDLVFRGFWNPKLWNAPDETKTYSCTELCNYARVSGTSQMLAGFKMHVVYAACGNFLNGNNEDVEKEYYNKTISESFCEQMKAPPPITLSFGEHN